MFWDRFRRTPEIDPSWASDLARVREVIARAPRGAAVDPFVVASLADLPLGTVLALLQVLARQRLGRLELRVVDRQGRELAAYRTLRDIPSALRDRFGDLTRVAPENVELVFRKAR
jgi:hypothetical protein